MQSSYKSPKQQTARVPELMLQEKSETKLSLHLVLFSNGAKQIWDLKKLS